MPDGPTVPDNGESATVEPSETQTCTEDAPAASHATNDNPTGQRGGGDSTTRCRRCGRADDGNVDRRCACGALLPGNAAAVTHGAYTNRARVPDHLARTAAELREAVLADLGGVDELSALEIEVIHRLCDLAIVANRAIADMSTNGIMTPAGKPRPAVAVLLQTTDRISRLAEQIGLKRRAKRVPSLQEYLNGQ
jgi:hypothetical protein